MEKETVSCPLCGSENPGDTFFCGKCGTKLGLKETPQYSRTMTMMAPAPELQRGKVFAGRYEIIEELGRGGMGSVYRVEDKKVNEEIALKLINPEIAQDRRIIDRFSHELKVARQISHRNVCRMYDLSEAEGTHFITMEYVPGEDLRSLLKRIGRLPEDKALSIARQVAEGLAEAHHLGIIHRDLKPGNVMVDREGNAKIMDFGIARSTKAKVVTATGMIIGTPDYMSPEQAEAKEVDGRADIYSLGVILYEMTTGQVPFEGETALAIAMKHKSERPRGPRDLNPQISVALSRLILKCLEKEKEKRFQTAEELSAELKALEGLPTAERMKTARRPLTPKEITVTFKLRRFLIPALAVVFLVAAGLVLSRLFLRPKFVERSIAVVNFQNQTGDAANDYLRSAIPNLLITSLEQSKYLQVTTFERLRDLLRQMGKPEVETIDADLGFELCAKDNVEALVLGSYVKAGETFATDVKIFDVRNRKLLKSFTAQGVGAQSILERQIGELSRQISRGVGLSKKAVDETSPQMAQGPTQSMEAYKYYLEGCTQFEKQYFEEARKNFEKSVGIDAEFAIPYLRLSQLNILSGDFRGSVEALKKAKELAAKAPEKDRLYIEAEYVRRVENNSEKHFRVLQEIATRYPKEKDAHSVLAGYYTAREMYPEAIAEAEKGLALDPKSPGLLNTLGLVYADAGDFAKGEEILKKAVAVAPQEPNAMDSLGELYYLAGRLDEAIEAYKQAVKIKPDFGSGEMIAYIQAVKGNYSEALSWVDQFILMAPDQRGKGGGYWWKAIFNHLSGRRDQAKTEMERVRGFMASVGEAGEAMASLGQGMLCYDRGEYDQALRHFGETFRAFMGITALSAHGMADYKPSLSIEQDLLAGFVAVKQKRIETARQIIAKIVPNLAQLKNSHVFGLPLLNKNLKILQAEVMVSEGRPEDAVALIERELKLTIPARGAFFRWQSVRLNFPFDQDVLARAYEKMGNIDKAIEAYQKLLNFDPKGQDRRMHIPVYHYRLAKLYDSKGLKEEARSEYQNLIDDWKDADTAIPELVAAKKRLGSPS